MKRIVSIIHKKKWTLELKKFARNVINPKDTLFIKTKMPLYVLNACFLNKNELRNNINKLMIVNKFAVFGVEFSVASCF